jgi:hypothetical protein
LVHPGVEEDHAVASGDREGVAVRDARPGQRETKPPHAVDDPLATPDLAGALAFGGGHGTDLNAGSDHLDWRLATEGE